MGYEREWMTVSPMSLYYWDSLAMEPWAPPRDVAYIVLAPDNDNLLTEVKTFFKVLSNGYESLKLGRHASGAKTLRDGVLKVISPSRLYCLNISLLFSGGFKACTEA